jgi:hypothetical protein
MEVTDGQPDRLVWPTTRLSVARPAAAGRDLVLVNGIEPNMRWRGFTSELVTAFTELDVKIVILLGALLADSPHTRPVQVTTAGIPAVSLWASVPHYVAQPPSPKATLALLHGVEDILDISLPLAELPDEARAWERGVDEVADYVRTLEEAKDAADLPEASGDAIAREFERYLRRRGDPS